MALLDFVFVHSYSSCEENWEVVSIGYKAQLGRITKAVKLADELGVPVVANDKIDDRNHACYDAYGIENLYTARNTKEEVRSALKKSQSGKVLFVSSPDHLPRVVRDVLALGGTSALFAASDTAFSQIGVKGVVVTEPPHKKL
jgi:hypothetical protein